MPIEDLEVDPELKDSLQRTLGYRCLARVECGTNGNVTPGLLLERSSKLHADRQQGGDATTVGGVLYIKCLADCCAARPLGLHSMGGSIYSGNAFEAHAGRSYRKKWRETIRVLPQGISLKAWLSSVGREYGAAEYAKYSSPRTKEELVDAALAAVAAAASAMASDTSAPSTCGGGAPRLGAHESLGLRPPLLKGFWGGLPHPQLQPSQAAALASLLGSSHLPLRPGSPKDQQQQQQLALDLCRSAELLPTPAMPDVEVPVAGLGQLRSAASGFLATCPAAARGAEALSGSRSSGTLFQGLQQQQQQRQQQLVSHLTPRGASPACDTPQQLPLLQVVAALHSLSSGEQQGAPPLGLQASGSSDDSGMVAPPPRALGDALVPLPVTDAPLASPTDNEAAVMVAVAKHIQSQAEQVQQLRDMTLTQQQRIQQQKAQLLQQAQRLDAQAVAAEQASQLAAAQAAAQLQLQQTVDVLRAGMAALISSQLLQAGSAAAAQQEPAERPAEASGSGALGPPSACPDNRHAVNDDEASPTSGPMKLPEAHATQHQPAEPGGSLGAVSGSDPFAGWLAAVAAAAALHGNQPRQAVSKRPREDDSSAGGGSSGGGDVHLPKRGVAH